MIKSAFFLLHYDFTEFFFSIGLLKVAKLLRVKGLVEGEGEKLLNPHIGKNGRPLVSTSMSDPPTSSSKLNGNGSDLRDRSEERRPTSDSKESPNGVPPGMPRFMPGMPQLPGLPFGLPGMFPSLLGKSVFNFHQVCQLSGTFWPFSKKYSWKHCNKTCFHEQVLEKDTDARTETIKTAKDLPAPDPEINAVRWLPVPADLAHPKRAEL